MNSRVSIIILNWNGWEDTIECLESVYQIDYSNYDVVVVDNGSEDNSVQKIKDYCKGKILLESNFFEYKLENKPLKVIELTKKQSEVVTLPKKDLKQLFNRKLILIKNDQNYGFAEGNNIGMQFALKNLNPKYILLLNNDTVVDSKFLRYLIKTARIDERIGIVGSKLLNAYNPKIIDSTGHIIKWGRIVDRGNRESDKGQYDKKTEVMGAMGAAALYSKKMLDDIGLLDKSYITLCEDADLSWRAYKKGWKAIFVPKSIVYHKRGRSITKKSVYSRMILLSTKNTVKNVKRYSTNFQKILFMIVLLKEGIFVILGRILKINNVNVVMYFKLLLRSYLILIKSLF